MKLTWKIVLKGLLRLIWIVAGAVVVSGLAYMILVKLLLAVHLKSLE